MNSLKKNAALPKFEIVGSMLIFSTLAFFVRYIPLPSSVIACVRGVVATLFLLVVALIGRRRASFAGIRKNLVLLLASGACIGINWVLLFEAYRGTTVAKATLCYYMAPVFVMLASPLVLRERMTLKKLFCVLGAFGGMVLVSGVLQTGIGSHSEISGLLFGLGAAAFYATVTFCNKKIKGIPARDTSIVQLGAATLVILPYALLTVDFAALSLTPHAAFLLFCVGILHTAAAFSLFFAGVQGLPANTVAIISYLDPVSAILLSALLLREAMDTAAIIGAVLILGCALLSELPEKRRAAGEETAGEEDAVEPSLASHSGSTPSR